MSTIKRETLRQFIKKNGLKCAYLKIYKTAQDNKRDTQKLFNLYHLWMYNQTEMDRFIPEIDKLTNVIEGRKPALARFILLENQLAVALGANVIMG